MSGVLGMQKRASDPLEEIKLQMVVSCWEWNPGPLEEQPFSELLGHLSSLDVDAFQTAFEQAYERDVRIW